MSKQSGFTLIELVIVITIVAILAAVAMPRYVAMQSDARIARLNAARGAVNSGSALVHGLILTRGGVGDAAACPGGGGTANNNQTGAGTACTESGLVATLNGYPAAILTAGIGAGNPGIIGAAGISPIFNPTVVQLAAEGYTVTGTVVGGNNVQTFLIASAPTPANCSFTYTQSAAAGAAGVVSAPTTTGC